MYCGSALIKTVPWSQCVIQGVFDWRSSGTINKFYHMAFSSVLVRCFK